MMMLYVLKCECGSVEFDNKRYCKECGCKFRNKYNHSEYTMVQFRRLHKKEQGIQYDPESGINPERGFQKPLYVLVCQCGSIQFDEKRKCLTCGCKFNNARLARDYMCVRYDWLAKFHQQYAYYYDRERNRHIPNYNQAMQLRREDTDQQKQQKQAKGERRLERKLQAFKAGTFHPDERQAARLRDYEVRKRLKTK